MNLQQDKDIQHWGIDFGANQHKCGELGVTLLRKPVGGCCLASCVVGGGGGDTAAPDGSDQTAAPDGSDHTAAQAVRSSAPWNTVAAMSTPPACILKELRGRCLCQCLDPPAADADNARTIVSVCLCSCCCVASPGAGL